MITGANGFIATTTYPVKSLQVDVKDGFGTISNRSTLTQLTVVFGNKEKDLEPGDTIYVEGETFQHAWAKNELDIDGNIVIMVPTQFIRFVKKSNNPWTDPLGRQ